MTGHYSITTEADHEVESLLARCEPDRELGQVQLSDYAPSQEDRAYAAIVTELSRIDLEYRFEEGESLDARRYIQTFPRVFKDDQLRTQLAFEEYRLRRRRGDNIEGTSIAMQYKVDGTHWPQMKIGEEKLPAARSVSRSFSKQDLARPPVHYPSVGETFAGYPLIARLGEGAFSRVFLARQGDLAGRTVVLKLTPLATDESDCLASLQHSSIIPVYSVHREQELTGICMPFLGATTLADLAASSGRWTSLDGPAEELISTIRNRRQSTINSLLAREEVATERAARDESDLAPTELSSSITPLGNLTQLSGLGYVDALLELAYGSVEGLAHAHRREIVHCDLKPANVLVADDGTPVLLDFNLAASTQRPETRVVGGTLPYMSPQQLENLERGGSPDKRDDVFSMGVILYELLTGRLPFESPPAGAAFDLQSVIDRRLRRPTSIRTLNPRVSPGLASIVGKCIEPDREQRYRDAGELSEDLRRHREKLPLRFAADPSVRERLAKWSFRHPRASSASTVGAVGIALVLLCSVMVWQRGQRIARLDAQSRFQAFTADVPNLILSLSSPGREAELLSRGLEQSEEVMSRWHVASDDWKTRSGADHLSPTDREILSQQLASLAYLMADARDSLELRKRGTDEIARRSDSSDWTRIGRELSPQRVRAGNTTRRGDVSAWRDQLNQRMDDQPTNVTLWFDLAVANGQLGNLEAALSEFDVANRLRPQTVTILLNRGLCHLDLGNNRLAQKDFDQCVQIAPDLVVPRFNRAVAAHRLGDHAAALEDLNQLVATGSATTRMVLFRAEVNQAINDLDAAAADRKAALALVPRDANDWVARGVATLDENPERSLEDFLQALRIRPTSIAAINDAAHVYSERLQKPELAIEMLSRLIKIRPASASAVASRGILSARIGETESALTDANAAAELAPNALERLQIAGIHAIVSGNDQAKGEQHKSNALSWLASAIRTDVRIARIAATDADLQALRSDLRYRQLLASASVIDRQSRSINRPSN